MSSSLISAVRGNYITNYVLPFLPKRTTILYDARAYVYTSCYV